MPEISRFFGIIITMYSNDHPPPHFHVRYGAHRARFAIGSLLMLDGNLTPRARGLVVEWATRHQEELAANWQLCQQRRPLRPVEPLE